jgi:hypothetical protein
MTQPDNGRRAFVKHSVYVVPDILTLTATRTAG